MSFKDAADNALDAVKKGAANAKDTLSEATHRSNADAEQASREVAGDAMTPGERAASVVRQGTETVKGEIDAAKRDVRNAT